ncbi:16653_t:CDS:2, partial [Acaulospora morrowiae]
SDIFMAPSKVLRWFGKSKNEEISFEYQKSMSRKPYKVSWVKPHETSEREIRYNSFGRGSINYRAEFDLAEWKKHISPPPVKQSQIDKPLRNSAADPRRFGIVEPLLNEKLNKKNLRRFNKMENGMFQSDREFDDDDDTFYDDLSSDELKSPAEEKKRRTKCSTCKGPIVEFGYFTQWCTPCQSKIFEENFGTWTSGNDNIDSLILESQLASMSRFNYLEWIPYDRFSDLTYIGSGGFGRVYHALWLDGPCEKWDQKKSQYVRCGQWKVALKRFNNSKNVDYEFFDELSKLLRTDNNSGVFITRCHGITQHPKTKDYMLVTQHAKHGNIRRYYQQNSEILTWEKRLDILYGIATGLMRLHKNNLMHKNLHSGNVLMHFSKILLGDFGIEYQVENVNSKILDDKDELYMTLGEWLSKVMFVPGSYISRQFKEADEMKIRKLERRKTTSQKKYVNESTHPNAVYTSSFINFKRLHLPNIIFTRTGEKSEHFEVKRYMAEECIKGEIKVEMIKMESTDVAAEVYEILNYL